MQTRPDCCDAGWFRPTPVPRPVAADWGMPPDSAVGMVDDRIRRITGWKLGSWPGELTEGEGTEWWRVRIVG